MATPIERGVQPLDALMGRLGLSNTDLVASSTEQLSFKMVQKGRKGRRLTPNIRSKILAALQNARPGEELAMKDLFNY